MSKITSFSNPELIDTSTLDKNMPTLRRHITQIAIGPDNQNDKPPIPPTNYLMINRLTSSIDELLANLTLLSKDGQFEQEQCLYELEQMFNELRKIIEKYYREYEDEIKSTYTDYEQHIYELKIRLKQVRQQLIKDFTSNQNIIHDKNDKSFDINKYRSLELRTTQMLNDIMKQQKLLPKYKIKLINIDQINKHFLVQLSSNSTNTIHQNHELANDNNAFREITPKRRSISIETSTSTNITDDYDNIPKDECGQYRVSYYHTSITPIKTVQRWSYPLHSGNYFIPLLTPYRQSSLLLYCLNRESFICYDSQLISNNPTIMKWRGTRPFAIYWFDEMDMLFVACRTYIYGCYLNDDILESERIHVRIPIEQTSVWSDTQGQLCWPKFLTCGAEKSQLLYAYWTDRLNKTATPSTSFIYYEINEKNSLIKSRFYVDGRLRALHSNLSTKRIGLLMEFVSNQTIYLEIRALNEFSLLTKCELRTFYEQFRYGCCLTNFTLNSNSYILCDHKQNQLWHVNGDTGDIQVKLVNESIYSVSCLLDGTLAILTGLPMRFDFIYDPNETGIILKELFHTEESFEV